MDRGGGYGNSKVEQGMSMKRLKGFIKRHWPFAWASSVREVNRQLKTAIKELVDLEQARREAGEREQESKFKMLSMQLQFDKILDARYRGAIEELGRDFIRVVEENKHNYMMCLSHEDFRIKTSTIDIRRMSVSYTVNLGLSPEMPPELIASTMADQMKRTILEKWRDQSILLDENFKL